MSDLTPPLIAEALEAIRTRDAGDYSTCPHVGWPGGCAAESGVLLSVSERDRLVQAAQREARETCGTCRHAKMGLGILCDNPSSPACGVNVVTSFGCTLHEPSVAPAPTPDDRTKEAKR